MTQPRDETYRAIATDPGASVLRACWWVFAASSLVAAIFLASTLFMAAFGWIDLGTEPFAFATNLLRPLVVLLALAPMMNGALSVVGLLLSAGLSHGVAKVLGGIGEYRRLVFTMAAYLAPGSLAALLAFFLPFVPFAVLLIPIYMLVLNVLAIRAVYGLGWGRALVSSTMVVAPAAITVVVTAMAAVRILGPAVGDVIARVAPEL